MKEKSVSRKTHGFLACANGPMRSAFIKIRNTERTSRLGKWQDSKFRAGHVEFKVLLRVSKRSQWAVGHMGLELEERS